MFVHCSKCLSFSFTQFVQFVLMPTPSSVYIRSKRIFNSHPSSEILNDKKIKSGGAEDFCLRGAI